MNLTPELEGVDTTEKFNALLKQGDKYCKNIKANITFFPLCCSTCIINNMTCSWLSKHDQSHFLDPQEIKDISLHEVKTAESICEVIELVNNASGTIFLPVKVARWNAMSKILMKCTRGTDDGPSGGYNNYKAAQIMMCDRIVEDKRNPDFAFGSYNIVYSVDHLMEFLKRNRRFGEIFVTTPKPGGHGARVRACVFTPKIEVLKAYHGLRLRKLKKHVIAVVKASKGKVSAPTDSVAAKW